MLKSRSSHVRVKVVALLLSLVALWSFAAFVTLREGLNLLSVAQLDEAVGRPSEALVGALQDERRASVVFLARPGGEQRRALSAQRARTDEARRTFTERAGSEDTKDSASAQLNQRIDAVLQGLAGLDRTRQTIDNATVGRTQAAAAFTDVITGTFRVFSALASLDAPAVIRDGNALTAMSRAREVLSQEDALLAGVLAAGRFTGTEHDEFVKLVGAQRVLHADVSAELPPADQRRYEELVNGVTFGRFRAAEDLIVTTGRTGAPAPVDAQTWQAAAEPVFAELRTLVLKAADDLIERVRPEAIAVIVRIVLAAGLGLLAVIASIIISITTARSLVRQLERLRTAAWELANERLPAVVDRLREGKTVDIDAEAPPLAFGTDEVGQLGEAFNAVQRTAVKTAVEQAELRRDVREVFLSLARRTQALVHRQLTMLDVMERREVEPEDLEALFQVDHLATRMRRNAENLIVLSGATPGRGWRKPVPLIDVVRGALAEVEDYTRVTVLPIGSAALAGRAVGDVTHLLAELIENATSFSPPATPVQVGGQKVASGFVIEVEDRGLGMSEADLAAANEQLRNPPEFKLSGNVRLGLYVVGRLALRHGVRVELRPSPYGGTLAIVLIPATLVIDAPDAGTAPAATPLRDGPDGGPPDGVASITAGGGRNGQPGQSRRGAANVLVGFHRPPVTPAIGSPAGRPTPDHVAGPAEQPDHVTAPAEQPENVTARDERPENVAAPKGQPGRSQVPGPEATPPEATPPAVARTAGDVPVVAGGPAVSVLPTRARTPAPPAAASTTVTRNGLPRRVRQASLAAPLQEAATVPGADAPAGPPDETRTPEEIRQRLRSYQQATVRGRSAAEHAHETRKEDS